MGGRGVDVGLNRRSFFKVNKSSGRPLLVGAETESCSGAGRVQSPL